MSAFAPVFSLVGLASLIVAHPAAAGARADRPARSATLTGVVQDLGPGRGALATATFDLEARLPSGTWQVAPIVGQRTQGRTDTTAVGGSVAWHHDWSGRIASGTEVFLAEAHGPFAAASLAQSLTGRVAQRTLLTATLRWARYQGGQDVWFVSGEGRRYFPRGSAAYRLTWIKPADRGGYASHLLTFTLNDAAGPGRTQLWLSQGQASLATSQQAEGFRGHDRALQLRRVQPLGAGLSLSLSGGLASYDLPAGAVQSRNAGLGLSLEF